MYTPQVATFAREPDDEPVDVGVQKNPAVKQSNKPKVNLYSTHLVQHFGMKVSRTWCVVCWWYMIYDIYIYTHICSFFCWVVVLPSTVQWEVIKICCGNCMVMIQCPTDCRKLQEEARKRKEEAEEERKRKREAALKELEGALMREDQLEWDWLWREHIGTCRQLVLHADLSTEQNVDVCVCVFAKQGGLCMKCDDVQTCLRMKALL